MQLLETLVVDDDGWRLTETGWDPDRAVALGSNFLVGNGYLGYRGTSAEQLASDFVALVVSDTYDCADGKWEELTTAPNPLFVAANVNDVAVAVTDADQVETSLDLRDGRFGSRFVQAVDGVMVTVEIERFASYDNHHLLAQRWVLIADGDVTVDLDTGIDGEVWSLNGLHLPAIEYSGDAECLLAEGVTVESGIRVATASTSRISLESQDSKPFEHVVRRRVSLAAGDELVVDTTAAVMSSNDLERPALAAKTLALTSHELGYETLRKASRERWDSIWRDMDVRIGGSVADQVALRFAAYHNRICTPAHAQHLPIGARGLSCQAYQGAAFWDQEIYNLPSFLFTEPDIARSLLIYRHKTLDGARRKAARLGYDGAYFAWVSGVTGDELCPDVFFTDVLTGRAIRNHFNVWQMHIAPDIVTTVARYVEVTGDHDFFLNYGAEIAFEVARFLRSFVRHNDWQGVYHCIRLLGPDEWHENVDDNAFTNYQTWAALDFAISSFENHEGELATLCSALNLTVDEVEGWKRIRDNLVLPAPSDGDDLIEQFAGFFQLEDVSPEDVRSRLIDPNEYWGWPNGVAVATQVSKQADVAMLLWLHAARFEADVIGANYHYYEPRCAHASSLSHAAYGMVAASLSESQEALEHFRATATVDLLNTNHAVVAGTFIGGLHTAACGGTYQLAVQGLGGLGFADGQLTIAPSLPDEWTSMRYPIRWRGNRLQVSIGNGRIDVFADHANPHTVRLSISGAETSVAPGQTVSAG